jgi:hypothetical protein
MVTKAIDIDKEDFGENSDDEENKIKIYYEEYFSKEEFRNSRLPVDKGKLSPLELFGILVSSIRKRRELSLEDVANRAGITKPELSSIELGRSPLEEVLENVDNLGRSIEVDETQLCKQLMDFIFTE